MSGSETTWAGGLLVAGFGLFLLGAAWWRPGPYQQELKQALLSQRGARRQRTRRRPGGVPAGFAALQRWAGLLYGIHMVTAYLAWGWVGAALLGGGVAPNVVGWGGVGW